MTHQSLQDSVLEFDFSLLFCFCELHSVVFFRSKSLAKLIPSEILPSLAKQQYVITLLQRALISAASRLRKYTDEV